MTAGENEEGRVCVCVMWQNPGGGGVGGVEGNDAASCTLYVIRKENGRQYTRDIKGGGISRRSGWKGIWVVILQ